jgi:hypothetical protein
VTQAGNQFFAKLSPGREIIEFESDLLTYFDSEDQFTSPVATSLSGQISIDNTSPNVSGVSTAFLTELNVGQDLYKNDGTLIGKIKKIVDDSNLILFSNAPALEYNIDYNNYTYVLNQYQYIDIGDTITYTELDGTISEYEIIEWSLADVREYTDPELNNVIVRRANYRAKKVTIPNDLTPIFYFNFNVIPIPASNQWIITADYDLSIEVGILAAPYDTLAVTLSNQPTGMTINNQTITWTPSGGQANQVYENIVITASNGTSSSTYTFSVRVYDVL